MINVEQKILSILNNRIWSSMKTIVGYCKAYGKAYSISSVRFTLVRLVTVGIIEKRIGRSKKYVYRKREEK